jgi:hypothetical protein
MSLTTVSSGDNIMITAVVGGAGNGYVTTASTITVKKPIEDILDKYEMNQLVVQHKVLEYELLKLKEVDINYSDHIKKNLTSSVAENITNRMSFTKSKDINMDSTIFRGRIWVFTKDELEELIKDARNA